MMSGFNGQIGCQIRESVQGRDVIFDEAKFWATCQKHESDTIDVAHDSQSGTSLAILGFLYRFEEATRKTSDANSVLQLYLERGFDALKSLDGSYQIVVFEKRKQKITLVADHLASRPVFYAWHHGVFSFGSSCSQVFEYSRLEKKIGRDGCLQFLAKGHPIGENTMFEGVFRLTPGTLVSTIIGKRSSNTRKWWNLEFDSLRKHKARDAIEELTKLLSISHAAATKWGNQRFSVALTGGYDSRLMAGVLNELGFRPDVAFTWTHHTGIAESDSTVAAKLATVLGFPHKTLVYGPETFCRNLDQWLLDSDLLSDNLGHIAGGMGFLEGRVSENLPVLIGDQLLGVGGRFDSGNQAISKALKMPFPQLGANLNRILTGDGRHYCSELLSSAVVKLLGDCNSNQPKDIHFYLDFYINVFGWLIAPGYYKEPARAARRPLINIATLKAVAGWSENLRIDKVIPVRLLKQSFPELYKLPIAAESALINWGEASSVSAEISCLFANLQAFSFLRESPLRDAINFEQKYNPGRAMPKSRSLAQRLRRRAVAMRRGLSQIPLGNEVFDLLTSWRKKLDGPPVTRLGYRLILLERFGQLISGAD